jgi:3-oxoacyl-[acyl-carrier protein] reductase
VIYGGGGTIGGAVARAFAREGAGVFLAGRTLEKLEKVAEEIRSAGERPTRRRWTPSTRRRSTSMPTP